MNIEKEKSIRLLKEMLIKSPIESKAPVYQPIYFSDFNDIRTSLNSKQFLKKFNIIFENIDYDLAGKRVIDIGSNTGYFSFAAAQRGAIVDAIETSQKYIELSKKLSEIYCIPNINFINRPIDFDLLHDKKYDYGFMLSVFQWISQGNKQLDYAQRILLDVSKKVDVLFFELGCNHGKSAINAKHYNHLAYIYLLLRKNTAYDNIKVLTFTKLWSRWDYRFVFVCSNKFLNIKEPFWSFFKFIPI